MISRFGTLIVAAHLTFCLPASAQDHLEPEQVIFNQPEWMWNYAKCVREVLLKDASSYHVARMICLPSLFPPEWVVTVVRENGKDDDAPQTYYVEYVGAEKKLFRADDPKSLTVKKARAPLDNKTAESLNKTWRRMLRTSRYPNEPRLGADGVSYHFSRFLPLINRGQPDPLGGWEQGTTWSPDDDSLCGELVSIGERLKEYAQAKPEDRDKLSSAIRLTAEDLGAKLDRRERNNEATRPTKQ